MHPDALHQAQLWDRFAEHSPELYPDRDPGPAVAFLQDLAGPDGELLELGAGSGRAALPMARSGLSVTALEVSPVLAKVLRGHVEPRLTVVEADMGDYQLTQSFDVICSVHSSFFHLTEQSRQVACMRRTREHLAPGGVFVLSCFVPRGDVLLAKNLSLEEVGASSVSLRATSLDYNAQRLSYREITLQEGGIRILPVEQRFCWPSELDLMAELAGLTLRARHEDYSQRPFSADSRRHVSVYAAT